LKLKVLLVVGTAMLLLAGLGAAALYPVSRSFEALELAEAQRNSTRVVHALRSRVEALRRTARDWSEWNDAYAFIQGRKDDFVDNNLYAEALQTLRVNLMVFYDLAGNIAWAGMYDLDSGEAIEIAEFAPGVLQADGPLLRNRASGGGPGGVMATSLGPALVVSNPILPSDAPDAPARGTLVLGQLLDDAVQAEIAEQTRVAFEVDAASAEPMTTGFGLHRPQGGEPVGHEPLPDIFGGTPLFVVHTHTPRDITALGQRAINLSLLLIGGTGVVAVLAIWALLHWLVLRPVLRLSGQVLRVGDVARADVRVTEVGNDEIGLLAREFNRTLARLDATRRQLAEQSHRAGMSAMAAGVLHNLRNGLSPLVGRLDRLAERQRQGPGAGLARAAAELADPALPAARRRRLADYVAATGGEIAAARAAQVAELAAMSRMAHNLGEIITGQDKFIYASDTVEPVALAAVLADAIDLLPAMPQRALAVEVDAGVAQLPAVAATSVALLQVLHNLLLNAAEAVGRAGRADGAVRVAGRVTGDVVELRVADNGAGIAAADLTRIFERGVTSKNAARGGLGLHWCATTIGALGGRLWATSDGPGRGATFHLQLRLVRPGEAAA
jgi:sensor domain CHASE-containing protein